MKKATIIGHFAEKIEYLDGQTIKTRIIAEEFRHKWGNKQIAKIDTHGSIKTFLKAPFQVLQALQSSKNIIILPAHNGLRVYAPLLKIGHIFFQKRKLHYVVIGGWLPEFLKRHWFTKRCLKAFNAIYVETNTMKKALEKQDFTNVYVMSNCKDLKILSSEELVYQNEEPYRLCTFSRVMKEKGIEDAINAVRVINEKVGRVIYKLDIYGPIDPNQTEWFEKIQTTFPKYVSYKGTVPSNKSVDVLQNYFLLVFPTRFFTEGIPGTIIDAYAAGVPVVASKWENFDDVIDEGVTGFGFSFKSTSEFVELLYCIAKKPQMVMDLKKECIKKAQYFTPDKAIGILVRKM